MEIKFIEIRISNSFGRWLSGIHANNYSEQNVITSHMIM